MSRFFCTAACLVWTLSTAAAQDGSGTPAAACDRLAGEGDAAAGIDIDAIDPATAAPACGQAVQSQPGELALPEPTGPNPVGVTSMTVAQPPFDLEIGVTLWYPALSHEGPDAVYVTPEVSRIIMEGLLGRASELEILSATDTHAIADAEPVGAELPLVVILAGGNLPGCSMGGLALELASRGYAVATVDWGYDMLARASTVLDELLAGERIRIDADYVAVIGHSYGGEAAASVVRADRRYRAGVTFDTTFPGILPDITADVDTPFMMFDSPLHANDVYSSNWRHLTGWRRWYIVQGTTHYSFTDYPLLFERLGSPGFEGATISTERASAIVRSYVAAFLDLHLRGRPQPLLEGPSFPEVVSKDPAEQ